MVFAYWIVVFIGICLEIKGAISSPVSSCPYGVSGNVYIADTHDACVYYWCVDGAFLRGGATFPCAPGSIVPENFVSSNNPCTQRRMTCSRDTNNGGYAKLSNGYQSQQVHVQVQQSSPVQSTPTHKYSVPWPRWVMKLPVRLYKTAIKAPMSQVPSKIPFGYRVQMGYPLGKEAEGRNEETEDVESQQNEEVARKTIIPLRNGLYIHINPVDNSAQIKMNGRDVFQRLNANQPTATTNPSHVPSNTDHSYPPRYKYYSTSRPNGQTDGTQGTMVSPEVTVSPPSRLAQSKYPKGNTYPPIPTTQPEGEMVSTTLPPTELPTLENTTDNIIVTQKVPDYAYNYKVADYAYKVHDYRNKVPEYAYNYEVPDYAYNYKEPDYMDKVPDNNKEVPDYARDIPETSYQEEPIGNDISYPHQIRYPDQYEEGRLMSLTESLFSALDGYFIPHGIPMVGITGLTKCLQACVAMPEVCAGLDYHSGIQKCWLHVPADECSTPLQAEDNTIHFRFVEQC